MKNCHHSSLDFRNNEIALFFKQKRVHIAIGLPYGQSQETAVRMVDACAMINDAYSDKTQVLSTMRITHQIHQDEGRLSSAIKRSKDLYRGFTDQAKAKLSAAAFHNSIRLLCDTAIAIFVNYVTQLNSSMYAALKTITSEKVPYMTRDEVWKSGCE